MPTNAAKFNKSPSRQIHGGHVAAGSLGWIYNASRNLSHVNDDGSERDLPCSAAAKLVRSLLTPSSDLDLMIANGYGDTPQDRLPEDWRTRRKVGRNV